MLQSNEGVYFFLVNAVSNLVNPVLLFSVSSVFSVVINLSNALEISFAFPIRHRHFIRALFRAEEMSVMLYHFRTKRALRKFAVRKIVRRLSQSIRHARQMLRGVNIAFKTCGRLNFACNAVKSRSQGRGKGQVRICVCAGDAAFDPQA
jgi:hypothetical protein